MRTPEEIKKGLECCGMSGCKECPYVGGEIECIEKQLHRDAYDYIQQLENQVAEVGKKVPKWIDVDERLPNHYDSVIVAIDGHVDSADFIAYHHEKPYFNTETCDPIFKDFYAGHEKRHVSHWMPMPEPPKEGNT